MTGSGAVLARMDELQAALGELQRATTAQGQRFESFLARLEEAQKCERQRTVAEVIAARPVDDPVRVTFFFQFPETWSTWASVWEALAQHPEAKVKLVCLPFFHDEEGAEARMRSFLAERDLPFVHVSVYDLEADAPDVALFQNPYDSTRPEEFSAVQLSSLGIRLAYVPYGLEVGGGAENLRWQYDLDIQRLAWRVYVRAPRHRRMYTRYCQAGSAHVRVTGHPKLDRFSQGLMSARKGALADWLGDRRAVLWTPHFSVEAGGWSTYLQYGETLLKAFEGRSDLALIVRPHPLFFGRMRHLGLMDDAREAAFRERLKASGNILLDESFDYAEAFACSEALIADAGSFILEYLPTGKPVLYLDQPQGPGLNEEGEVVRGYYPGRNDADIVDFIAMMAHGEDPMCEQRLALIPEFFNVLDGKAGERIAEDIIEGVRAERRLAEKGG
ncbi:CDP-Glycerol:Poly(glycerophosphate) glycerophosphotransferase [compost metagenome]